MPPATALGDTENPSAVTFGQRPGLRASHYAGKLVIHPVSAGADTGRDVTIYRTANTGNLELAFKLEEEWVIIPDKHPVIVSKEVFDEVQKIVIANKSKKKKKQSHNHLLRGNIVKCGCCGYALYYDKSCKKHNGSYRCHHTLSDQTAKCHRMKVNANELHSAVMMTIRKQAELILGTSHLSSLKKVNTDYSKASQYENQQRELTLERQKYYEQFVSGEMKKTNYQMSSSKCEK